MGTYKQLVAERDMAGWRQDLAYAPQFTRRIPPEVQDVAGQDEVGGRIPGGPADIAGHQGQAALGEGARVAAPRAGQHDGRWVGADDAGGWVGAQQFGQRDAGPAAEF